MRAMAAVEDWSSSPTTPLRAGPPDDLARDLLKGTLIAIVLDVLTGNAVGLDRAAARVLNEQVSSSMNETRSRSRLSGK